MLVEPDGLGRLALGEEEQVGLDAGIRAEHPAGQSHNSVQIAGAEQLLFDPGLHAFAEERAVRQDDGAASSGREQVNNQLQE